MKPTYIANAVCYICKAVAVGLDSGETAVCWCENGHVVVMSPDIKPNVQEVFDFSKGEN